MKTLIINSANTHEIVVGLRIDGKTYSARRKIASNKTQVILPTIDSLLRKHHVKLQYLDKIEVNTGIGSYMGIRVGVAIANTLSFLLNIPVNNRKVGEFAEPLY